MKYTLEQLKILEHNPNKHACILAGPGTGKSSIIISYMIKIHENNPDKVFRLLTFTRAANRELIDKILKAGHEEVVSSTIHSFAISILLNNPGISRLPEPIRIANDWEWKELIRKDIARRLATTPTIVDKLKNEMSAHWESLSPEKDVKVPEEIRARFMGMWEEHRRIYSYTLLAELPFRLKIALEENSDLDLGYLELIAVDEYQDLNACDLKCIKLISEQGTTIIAIGDDDQSIYQFRKAHPAGIRNFSKEYKAINYPLTISHRCGRKILNWANYVIQGDTTRIPKPSLKPGSNCSDGKAEYLVFNRENREAEGIVRLVKWLKEKEKVPLEEILILVRTGALAKLIKNTFIDSNINYADPEEALELLNYKKTRELLCILHLLTNKSDSLAWWTLIYLTKGIGNRTISEIYKLAKNNNSTFGDILLKEAKNDFENIKQSKCKVSNRVKKIFSIIEKIKIPEDVKWGNWIIEQIKDEKLPVIPKDMEKLLIKIDNFKEEIEQNSLNQYISQTEPIVKDIMNSKISDHVRIMTISRSKGLTVRAVILAGVEDEIIPFPKGDYQEERRLLYVGMTRARDYLYITRCRRRCGYTARSGIQNVAGRRLPCRFLNGGPVSQLDGEKFINQLGF